MIRRLFRAVMWSLLGAGIVVLVCGVWAYRATQSVPEFYQQAIAAPAEPAVMEAAGEQLEQQVLELRNDVQRVGRWEAVFSDEQLNAWFAVDLPEKFPRALPADVRAPRIKIAPDRVLVAAKYDSDNFDAIISAEADLFLTDRQNELALRIRRVRAGALPLPLNQFLQKVTNHAHKSGVSLRWTHQEGDPVALLQIPAQHEDYAHRELYLDTIELREGAIFLAGRTEQIQNGQSTASRRGSRSGGSLIAAK